MFYDMTVRSIPKTIVLYSRIETILDRGSGQLGPYKIHLRDQSGTNQGRKLTCVNTWMFSAREITLAGLKSKMSLEIKIQAKTGLGSLRLKVWTNNDCDSFMQAKLVKNCGLCPSGLIHKI